MLLVMVVVLLAASSNRVGGQETPPSDDTESTETTVAPTTTVLPAGSLTLLGQSPYVAADGLFSVRLGWTGTVAPDLSVAVTIRGRISRESQLGADTSVLNRLPVVPLITVRQPDGSLQIDLPIRSFSQTSAQDTARILVPDAGVYPVVVEIRDAVGTIASITTFLVRLPTETAEIDLLAVSTVLPISSADGLGLDDAIRILEAHPDLPLTVLLETGVVSELVDDPAAAQQLQAAIGGRTLIVGSTLDLDPSALAEIGQGSLYAQAIVSSRAVLEDLGLHPSATMLPLEPALTTEGAGLLRGLGIETVFDAEGGTNGIIDTGSGSLRVTGVDEDLTSLLATSTDSVAAAHLLIARLALRAETDISPVLIGGPLLRQASLDSIDIVLSAQETVGLLEPASLEDLSALSPSLAIRAVENPTQDLVPVSDLIAESLGLIDTYQSFYSTGAIPPEVFANGLFAALGRDRPAGDRRRAIEQVDDQIREAFDVITIREGQSMTLTARQLVVPLSIENRSTGDRMVQLHFTGDKVAVAEDGQNFLLPPGLTTIDITVEARALGLSPLDVEALTPDGQRSLSKSRLQIRSTAVPGLGLLLSGAALVFLISWWIVSIGRTRALKHQAALDASTRVDGVNVESAAPLENTDHPVA